MTVTESDQRQKPATVRRAAKPDDDGIGRNLRVGVAAVLFLLVGGGGWAAVAQLKGAVVAAGTVVVESYVKRVQHPDGGVVGAIMVSEGESVEAGDLLIRLDDTVTRANLMVVDSQLVELAARRARLEAERDGLAEIRYDDDLLARRTEPKVARALDGEISLFASRRTAREGEVAQLRAQIGQLGDEAAGLTAQIEAKTAELAVIAEEIAGLTQLYDKGLTPVTRLRAMQRERIGIEGDRGRLQAERARSRGRLSETELQIIQLDQKMRAEVIEQLRELEAKWAELQERQIAAQDKLTRVDLRAPIAGAVHQLTAHTVGGVIGAGETVMLIVPGDDRLVVETQIAPNDIDQVAVGQPAVLRLAAFNQKTTPELDGVVSRVSADLTTNEQTGMSYYVAQIALPESELAEIAAIKVLPGMPAEVYLQTGERTALSYLVKPLMDQFARALREE
ncbi:HlyD family type I secretion periplasmic adaptor subunit [Marinimicrococcus flavescens]|uniref:Membrane fusion protein (MFP) family protein n=1 Tax=Marinimicrococcus flavescens TaxID=3031815 RepID=A0AAP4D691_9PROT|nr:HlyD family type I secretion periplasmic adaptor subunit [Marinimicrococcus flavescens]